MSQDGTNIGVDFDEVGVRTRNVIVEAEGEDPGNLLRPMSRAVGKAIENQRVTRSAAAARGVMLAWDHTSG